MNIKQLEYFVDLSETLNFTKTAQNFYISQTAITKQIQCLEDDFIVQRNVFLSQVKADHTYRMQRKY